MFICLALEVKPPLTHTFLNYMYDIPVHMAWNKVPITDTVWF